MRLRCTVSLPPQAEPNFVGVDPRKLREGQRVVHERFGAGLILEISGDSADKLVATIRFDNFDTKKIMLKYGKLRLE